jgi:hypothetical protein
MASDLPLLKQSVYEIGQAAQHGERPEKLGFITCDSQSKATDGIGRQARAEAAHPKV